MCIRDRSRPCADFPNVAAERHIFGRCASRGGLWPPNSNSVEIFVQCTYPQVSWSYVHSFGSIVLANSHKHTNKQTSKQTRNQMHRHKSNAIPAGSYVGYFFPYITIGYRKNAEIYSGNFQKVALWNSLLCHAASRGRDKKVLHVCTSTFLLVCNMASKVYLKVQVLHWFRCAQTYHRRPRFSNTCTDLSTFDVGT